MSEYSDSLYKNGSYIPTMQHGIKKYQGDMIKNYALFLGGLNTTKRSLQQYDPLHTGYGRIFFTQMPVFMEIIMPEETAQVRHLFEYGFKKVDGLGNLDADMQQISGGYAGRQFDVYTGTKDGTSEITLGLYEFAGSPLRTYINMWMTGISDPYTGLGTYHGAWTKPGFTSLRYAQYNHVAEAFYVATDPTGRADTIEYCCLLTNMMPKSCKIDHFNYNSGDHPIVEYDITFSVVKYESPQINEMGKVLLKRFQILKDYLFFNSEYTADELNKKFKPHIKNWPDELNVGATSA